MNCKDIKDSTFLDSYLLDRLSAKDKQLTDQHIKSCKECHQYIDEQQSIVDGIRSVGKEDMIAEIKRQASYTQKKTSDKFFRMENVLKVAAILIFFVITPFYFYYNRPIDPESPLYQHDGTPSASKKDIPNPLEPFAGMGENEDDIVQGINKPELQSNADEADAIIHKDFDELDLTLPAPPTKSSEMKRNSHGGIFKSFDEVDLPAASIPDDESVNTMLQLPVEDLQKQFGRAESEKLTVKESFRSFTSGEISGTITNTTGEPLVGVQVYIPELGLGGLTNDSGEVLITGVPDGIHDVVVSSIGYETISLEDVAVQSGLQISFEEELEINPLEASDIVVLAEKMNIQMDMTSSQATISQESVPDFRTPLKGGIVTGYVKDINGEPIQGAEILVNKYDLKVTSDANGHFVIDNLPLKKITLKITKEGYKTDTIKGINLRKSNPSSIEIILKTESGGSGQLPDSQKKSIWHRFKGIFRKK